MPSTDSLLLVVVALTQLVTAIISWRTHQATQASAINIQKIETATNSMKDQLVMATANAAHAAGREEGRLEGEDKAATLAQGQLGSTK